MLGCVLKCLSAIQLYLQAELGQLVSSPRRSRTTGLNCSRGFKQYWVRAVLGNEFPSELGFSWYQLSQRQRRCQIRVPKCSLKSYGGGGGRSNYFPFQQVPSFYKFYKLRSKQTESSYFRTPSFFSQDPPTSHKHRIRELRKARLFQPVEFFFSKKTEQAVSGASAATYELMEPDCLEVLYLARFLKDNSEKNSASPWSRISREKISF